MNNYKNLNFILIIKSHLQSYPCALQINSYWNIGFLLGITIINQIITGILLTLHYTAAGNNNLNSAFYSLYFIIREIYYGWSLRYIHSNGASFIFLLIFIHIGRAISYTSYLYNPNIWFTGIIILILLMAIAFMGYILPFGQMSFWAARVITNLLSPFPLLIEYISGGYIDFNPTLKRFFIIHFILPFILYIFILIHLFYLHLYSSNNPLILNINNKIIFYPYIFIKDLYILLFIYIFIFIQLYFQLYSLLHPDNGLEVNILITPLHIVPEWYFLCQYSMLKALPNKNAGFIILLTSIILLLLFTEIINITTLIILTNSSLLFNNIFHIYISIIYFIWIGAGFPQEKFISYVRILTLHYYISIISILISLGVLSFLLFILYIHHSIFYYLLIINC